MRVKEGVLIEERVSDLPTYTLTFMYNKSYPSILGQKPEEKGGHPPEMRALCPERDSILFLNCITQIF